MTLVHRDHATRCFDFEKSSDYAFLRNGVVDFEKKSIITTPWVRFFRQRFSTISFNLIDCADALLSLTDKEIKIVEHSDKKMLNPSIEQCELLVLRCYKLSEILYQASVKKICTQKAILLERLVNKQRFLHEKAGEILRKMAKFQKKGPTFEACRIGLFHTAVCFFSMDEATECSIYATQLVQTAWKLERKEVALMALLLCRDFTSLSVIKEELFFYATSIRNQRSALKLLESNLLFSRFENEQTALHQACLLHNQELVEAIISTCSQNVLNGKDVFGNTPLHYACLGNESPKIALALIEKGADFLLCNNKDQIPLVQLLFEQGKSSFYKILFQELGCRIENFSIQEYRENSLFIIEQLENVSEETLSNLLEIAFLLQDKMIAQAVVENCSKEVLLRKIACIEKKYPAVSHDWLFFVQFSITKTHLLINEIYPELKPPIRKQNLDRIMDYFDRIDFFNKNSFFFLDREELAVDTGTKSIPALREILRSLIQSTKDKTAILGSPESGKEAIWIFYEKIENMLENIIFSIEKSGEVNQKKFAEGVISTVGGLLRAGGRCAGRYYYTAICLYYSICCDFVPTFEKQILLQLVPFRDNLLIYCLDKIRKKANSHDLHEYIQILQKVGDDIGVPGAALSGFFDDPYKSCIDKRKIVALFFSLYTPEAIVKDWFQHRLQEDANLREAFIDWSKSKAHKKWRNDFFEPLIEKVKKSSNKEIEILFKEHNFFSCDGESPIETIFKAREHDYLENFVFDMNSGAVRFEAICDMLVVTGVIQEACIVKNKGKIFFERFQPLVSEITHKIWQIFRT